MAETGPQTWKDHYDRIEKALSGMSRGSDGQYVATKAALKAVKNFLETVDDGDTRLRVLGTQDVDRMLAVCRTGEVTWWPLFTGRVFEGDLDGMQKVWSASRTAGVSLSPSSAMTWITSNYTLPGEYRNNVEPRVLRQLINWGADPNYEKGKWFETGLRNLGADNIRVLADNGGDPQVVFRVLNELQQAGKEEQAQNIRDALSRDTLYFKVDDNTLVETKHVPSMQGAGSYKTVFNFAARRVNEIYEPAIGSAAMNSFTFDEYDYETVAAARDRLVALGGKPPEPGEKPRFKVPS